MTSDAGMQDDTVKGSPPLTKEDLARMRELAGYSINRHDAELWAQNDVKFLVYDDTSVLEGGYDSDDEESTLEFALRLSETTDADGSDTNREASSARFEDSPSCFCKAAPAFPKKFHPRKLKLFRPEKSMSCNHYVAVSYCWPEVIQDEDDSSRANPYQVRDLNGVVRPARTPVWALRRAIDVAASCGLNMIWIDQECLPQPTDDSPQAEKDEQQKGIQAMDIIYSRATVTAGLLSDAQVASQEHIDALAKIQSWELNSAINNADELIPNIEPPPDVEEKMINLAVDIFESIISDRWYTRAWIAQEALSSGSSLMLVLSQGPDAPRQRDFAMKMTESQEQRNWESMSSEIYVIPVGVLHKTLSLTQKLLPYSLMQPPDRPPANISTMRRAIPAINRAREYNMRLSYNNGDQFQWLVGAADKDAGSRCTVDAATALGLLNTRRCRDVQDRIAIVANMCNFHVRLNTAIMAKQCKSLKLALLTLAIANGDYSLLVPETFAVEHGKCLIRLNFQRHAYQCFSVIDIRPKEAHKNWLWPFDNALDRIDHRHSQMSGLVCPFIYSHQEAFSSNGIRLSANIWEVKDKIDMRPIQRMWSGEWDRLTRVQTHLTPRNMEGTASYVRGYISMRQKNPEDAQFLQQMEMIGNFVEYPGEWPYGVKVCKPMLDSNEQSQKDLGDMIFAVIRHLYELSKEDRDSETALYALSLANALWHSVRTTVEPITVLPDVVGEWLYHHQGLERNSYEMLDLIANPDGNIAQTWFLERIMRDGYLWVGRYVAASTINREIISTAQLMDSLEPKRKQVLNTRNPVAIRQIARNSAARFERLLRSDGKSAASQYTSMDERKSAVVTEIRYYREWSDEDEARRSKECAALFDVDGPCVVAVPFNGAWEVLPRPSTRSMSICWVVAKSASKAKGKGPSTGSEEEDEEDEYQVVKKVKGLFECMYMPRGRYIFS